MHKFFPLLLLVACDDVVQLSPQCGQPCIIMDGEALVSGKDACSGELVCHGDGVQECVGYRASYPETCNGQDDDCDGLVDEGTGFVSRQDGNPCLGLLGACAASPAVCVEGTLVCTQRGFDEVCNGQDDDCDGDVDEELGVLGFEYTGPPETASVGECRPGVLRCKNGAAVAEGQVLPAPEQCGDDKDSDCDGSLNPDLGTVAHDVVLVIDYSGSMGQAMEEVAYAVCDWGDADRAEHNFAAIAVSPTSSPDGTVEVLFDFVPPDEACLALLDALHLGGGFEFMLDGIMLAHKTPLSFSGAPQDFLVFTDEELQENVYRDFDVARDCVDNEYHVTVFTEYMFSAQWDVVMDACGGTMEQLSSSHQMRDKLLEIFGTYCVRNP